jgi:hypothetical protein
MTSDERRRHPRIDDNRVSGICGRIRPGHVARVMNLSAEGALIETARRLVPGGIADLHLEAGELRHATRVRVARSEVSRVLPDAMCFCCAVTFDVRLAWLSALPIESNLSNDGGAAGPPALPTRGSCSR